MKKVLKAFVVMLLMATILNASSLNPDYAIGKFQSKQTYYKI